MNSAAEALPDNIPELKKLLVSSYERIDRLERTNGVLQQNNEVLTEQLALWQKKFFGRKSEKYSGDELLQSRLFDGLAEDLEESPRTEDTGVEVQAHRRKRPVRTELPDNLPTVDVVHDIPEEQKRCGCGAELKRIGEEVSKKLDIIPAKFQVIRHIRPKYACSKCEGSGDEEHPAVRIAPPPPQIIPKGIPTAGFVAYIVTAKYCDAIPLYRQEKQFSRIGIDISRSSLCGWVLEAAERCTPLIELMLNHIRAGPMIEMDETTVQVLKELAREDTSKSYMWVMCGGDMEHPVLLYRYHPTRSKEVPKVYLSGYHGYLKTDAYPGYDEIGEADHIIHVGCWAHTRRKFDEASAATKKTGAAEKGIAFIGKLYRVERELRPQLERKEISSGDFVRMRKERVEPVLESFRKWLESKVTTVLPSSLLGKAVAYTLNQWPKLERYLEQAYLTPDTNRVENAIRPFCVGKRNWLFSGSPRGAHAGATLYSLIETAKANGIEPYRYLRYVFEQIPLVKEPEDLEELLPYRIDAAGLNTKNL
jgi:transposase